MNKSLENSYCSIEKQINEYCTVYGLFIKSTPPLVKFNSSGDCSNYSLRNWSLVIIPKILENIDSCNLSIGNIGKIIIEFEENNQAIPNKVQIEEDLHKVFPQKKIEVTLIDSQRIMEIEINTMPNKG